MNKNDKGWELVRDRIKLNMLSNGSIGCEDPPDRLGYMLDIRDGHRGFGRHWIRCRAVSQRGLPVPLNHPLLLRAWVMSLFSASLSGADMQILSAHVRSVRATAILCTRGWWELKSNYLSVWVFFLNTDVAREPSV